MADEVRSALVMLERRVAKLFEKDDALRGRRLFVCHSSESECTEAAMFRFLCGWLNLDRLLPARTVPGGDGRRMGADE